MTPSGRRTPRPCAASSTSVRDPPPQYSIATQQLPRHTYVSYAATRCGCRTVDAQRTSSASAAISASSRGRTRFNATAAPAALTPA